MTKHDYDKRKIEGIIKDALADEQIELSYLKSLMRLRSKRVYWLKDALQRLKK